MISIEFLDKAIDSLDFGLNEFSSRPDDLLVRDGVIQRFKYAYDKCFPTMQRMLKQTEASAEGLEDSSFKVIIRTAAQKGWLDSPESWFEFREARNKTSHAYSRIVSDEVYKIIPQFLEEARKLSFKLKSVEY